MATRSSVRPYHRCSVLIIRIIRLGEKFANFDVWSVYMYVVCMGVCVCVTTFQRCGGGCVLFKESLFT